MTDMKLFKVEIENLINIHSIDSELNTPDYILADYLVNCLEIYRKTNEQREKWHGRGRQVSVDATDTWEDTRAWCAQKF